MTTATILAFAGSARRDSWNRKVLEVAVAGARDAGAEVTVVNLGDYPMPIYNADWHEQHGVPDAMLELRRLMMAANGLLIASPEYNTSITPLLKNTIDWCSRKAPGEEPLACYRGKVAGLVSASLTTNLRTTDLTPPLVTAFNPAANSSNQTTRPALTCAPRPTCSD